MEDPKTTYVEAAKLSQEAYKAAKASLDTTIIGMSSKTAALFREAVQKAAVRVNEVGEKAMAEAVQDLASKGIFASTHTDKNGRLYRVPADVAVRQAVYTSGTQRFNNQVLGVAMRTGRDLIEINETPNCRPSHEVINGKIFSISGMDYRFPKWTPDLEALTHDYNCGHEIAIYHEELGSVFTDPLEGTGYTIEEARKAFAKQRRYENEIRKQKRVVEALKAGGMDTTEANAKLNATRHRLKKHIDENSAILRRERHREQLYDSAQRMKNAGKFVPPKAPPAVKVIQKTGDAFADAVAKTSAKGAGYTAIATARSAERPSIGAAKRGYELSKKAKAIRLSEQELAIVKSAINFRFEKKYAGAEFGTIDCETVGGAYTYIFRIIEKDEYVFLRRVKID